MSSVGHPYDPECNCTPCCNEAGVRDRGEACAKDYAERRHIFRDERTAAVQDFCAGWNAYDPTKDGDDTAWSHASGKYGFEEDIEGGRRDFRAGWDGRFAWEERYQRTA